MPKVFLLYVLLSAATSANFARSALVIDQDQSSWVSGGGNSALIWAQSFVPESNNIAGVGVFQYPTFLTGEASVSLAVRETLAGQNLAFGDNAIDLGKRQWIDVIFDDPVMITSGETYYLVITHNELPGISANFNSASYAIGDAYYSLDDGSTFRRTDLDLVFRTFADDSFVVPLPGSLWFFCTSLLGLFASKRLEGK